MAPRVHEVVHTLRQKPQHVRENLAIGVSGGVTLVVALGWLVATAQSGTFALSPASPTDPEVAQAVATGKNNFSELLGAAGAAIGATNTPASITIVDTQVHSTFDERQDTADATVIHF